MCNKYEVLFSNVLLERKKKTYVANTITVHVGHFMRNSFVKLYTFPGKRSPSGKHAYIILTPLNPTFI